MWYIIGILKPVIRLPMGQFFWLCTYAHRIFMKVIFNAGIKDTLIKRILEHQAKVSEHN